ncbi:hypothetical protein BN1708_012481 [Verticillium longisporum]|uniref:C2H2-type domain-containing protein n=1 Tax=Verticillium longisporum TaxID=100787 RepID=A0A0G4LAJ5_VERLO|nr:hypothetical protein BN1708_012481 [Verticillium longisporum]
MSDVRALLRQQRAARRIDHPFAAYSDAGKLLCTLCHEAVKAESLWDAHLRSSGHTDKSQKQQASQKTRPTTIEEQTNGTHKRKHDSDSDAEDATMVDATARKKRSRNDMNTPARSGSESSSDSAGGTSRDRETQATKDQTLTPPTLNRRTSTTPVQGGEMLIPSRPATPHHRDGTSSTATPLGPSPLIPQDPIAPSAQPDDAVSTVTAQQKVDEDEWAAFEADIAAESLTRHPSNMVDIFEIAPQDQAARPAPALFAYAGQEARIVRYQHLLSKLASKDEGEGQGQGPAGVQVNWLPQEDTVDVQRRAPSIKSESDGPLSIDTCAAPRTVWSIVVHVGCGCTSDWFCGYGCGCGCGHVAALGTEGRAGDAARC